MGLVEVGMDLSEMTFLHNFLGEEIPRVSRGTQHLASSILGEAKWKILPGMVLAELICP